MSQFDRKIYFDSVRKSLFGGQLDQGQVDGQEALLTAWEKYVTTGDLRHFSYMLATTMHETASEMLPVEEYGKGSGQPYGVPDPETGQVYYGRGYVQITWRDNYARATRELKLTGSDDLEWHAARALDPIIAARTMYLGMMGGWFRTRDGAPETLPRYFDQDTNDPYNARGIINGDKATVPSWSNGVSIGNLIKQYHEKFLDALLTSEVEVGPVTPEQSRIDIKVSGPVSVFVNGQQVV